VDAVLHLVLAVPPGLALASLLVLIGTQAAYLLAPSRAPYPLRLGISALAVALGELLAAAGAGSHLALGQVHPYQDLALLAVAQWALSRWRRRSPSTSGRV
jgi:hypothetical protein